MIVGGWLVGRAGCGLWAGGLAGRQARRQLGR